MGLLRWWTLGEGCFFESHERRERVGEAMGTVFSLNVTIEQNVA